MPEEIAQPAAAEPVAPRTAGDASDALAALSPAELDGWRQTGAIPEPKPAAVETVEDDADDKPAAVATPPADGKPAPTISKRQQQINDLIRERATSDQRVKALEAELEAARRTPGTQPAREAPADAPVEPKLEDFLDQPDPWVAFTKATSKYEAAEALRAADEARSNRERRTHAESALDRQFQTYQERETAFKATQPDYDAATLPIRTQIFPQTPIFDVITDSPVGPAMIRHFADHLDVFDRLVRLQAVNPYAALRELGKLESKIESKLDDQASSASAAAAPVTKTVTSAPAPPMTVGTRAADPVDDVSGALKRRDFTAYASAANRRDLAKR